MVKNSSVRHEFKVNVVLSGLERRRALLVSVQPAGRPLVGQPEPGLWGTRAVEKMIHRYLGGMAIGTCSCLYLSYSFLVGGQATAVFGVELRELCKQVVVFGYLICELPRLLGHIDCVWLQGSQAPSGRRHR